MTMRQGTIVDATLIAAPSSTKNEEGKRDPELHQTKEGNQWHHGMKLHVGVGKDSGLIHSIVTTAANVHDLIPAAELLHGGEEVVYADAGYQGIAKRPEMTSKTTEFRVAMRPGQRRRHPPAMPRPRQLSSSFASATSAAHPPPRGLPASTDPPGAGACLPGGLRRHR
jgi:IS5 family transposase